MRESSFFKGLRWQFLCLVIAAVVLAMIGPYGTFSDLRLDQRLLYWTLSTAAGWLITVLIAATIDQFDSLQAWPIAGRMTLAGLIGAIPMAAVVWLLESMFRRSLPASELPLLLLQVAVLTVLVSVTIGQAVEFRLRGQAGTAQLNPPALAAEGPTSLPDPPGATAPPAAAAPRPAAGAAGEPSAPAPSETFLRRLPPTLGRDLLALEMEDHYARVHTALGSTLILMRLRDAMTELGAGAGLQVHRSWWVAREAVTGIERDGGKQVLVLRNGLRVPVSKTYRDAIKAMPWSDA